MIQESNSKEEEEKKEMSIAVHAHHVLFRYYRGRGAFESMGAGLEMKPGDIAFKVT